MFFSVKFKQILYIIAIIAGLILSAILVSRCPDGETRRTSAADTYTLVIDPGHGGFDGGSIAADGTRESGINLAIAQKMRALANFYGYEAVLTRETDESSGDISDYSERAELLRRAEIANNTPNAVLISVHQNEFPTSEPTGAQVLYGTSDESKALGLLAQDALVSFADPENRRVAAPVSEKLLLTKSVSCPVILAECGFMSNAGEAARLSADSYQTSLACALVGAYMHFSRNDKAL